jgi:hypothetical protein
MLLDDSQLKDKSEAEMRLNRITKKIICACLFGIASLLLVPAKHGSAFLALIPNPLVESIVSVISVSPFLPIVSPILMAAALALFTVREPQIRLTTAALLVGLAIASVLVGTIAANLLFDVLLSHIAGMLLRLPRSLLEVRATTFASALAGALGGFFGGLVLSIAGLAKVRQRPATFVRAATKYVIPSIALWGASWAVLGSVNSTMSLDPDDLESFLPEALFAALSCSLFLLLLQEPQTSLDSGPASSEKNRQVKGSPKCG